MRERCWLITSWSVAASIIEREQMVRKRAIGIAAALMAGVLGFSAPVTAHAAGYGNVSVSKSDGFISIGNNAIERKFSIANGKLKTTEINNKLGGNKLVPGDDSEEFLLESLATATRKEPENALTSVKPGGAAASATGSTVDTSEGALASNAIDGKANTYWASTAQNAGTANLVVGFGSVKTVKTVEYTPRVSGSSYDCTGRVKTYKLEYQDASGAWHTVVENGTMQAAGKTAITLDNAVSAKAIRLTGLTTYHWQAASANKVMNVAELDAKDEGGSSVIVRSASNGWKVTGTSVASNDGGGYAALIDGDFTTYYHSNYGMGEGTNKKLPVDLTIDRGEGANESFQTVGYAARNVKGANGTFKKFEVYVSDKKDDLFKDANKKGNFEVDLSGSYNDDNTCKMTYFELDEAQSGRYVGIRVKAAQGDAYASGAELNLYKEKFSTFETGSGKPTLKTSELELNGEPKVTDTSATINKKKKTGKKISFTFKPVQFGTGNATVTENVVMYDGDHFMRKYLEVESEDKSIRFNYIDGEHLNVKDAQYKWTIPTDKGGVVEMSTERANLGQPIYVNGLFMGSEFPETDTQIVDDLGRMRYWTGKNFDDFSRDGQLTDDGKYVSWQTVCGASHSNGSDNNVIRTDFYSYIKGISKPSEFRIQYNSWFDNMMRIDENNILDSFKAVDKNFSETGVRPLDSYVVDDGWNNYNPTEASVDLQRSGTGKNTAGFWTFNSKFPNKLSTSSSLVEKLGSNFGVWIGPRGGYNFYGQLAGIISAAGNGSKAGGSIDVADQRYVDKFQEMALQWMTDYHVNYWKWDGFADNAQYGAFAQGDGVVGYDENHHHMYGGPSGFYHATDLWEKWIVLFDNVWDKADQLGINNLWISLTCYVNPSPWFLQWSSSIWMQCWADRSEVSNGTLNNKMDNMLTYRDASYYDFVKNHDFQFPLANIYNHDPIYGKEGTGITANSMNGAQFRNYLYMMATRGTAFWELYYSDSIFNNEKYLVNADFLKWAEANYDKLQNSKMIGGNPASGVKLGSGQAAGTQEAYGFSCFNNAGTEGIVSMRNPAATEKTITFKLDAGVGASASGAFKRAIVESYTADGSALGASKDSYNQGETVTVTLKPGETQIWNLSQKGDAKAPAVDSLYIKGADKLRVQTSEHVNNAAFVVKANGEELKLDAKAVKGYADNCTFDITLPKKLDSSDKVEVSAAAGTDASGNKLAGTVAGTYHAKGAIAKASTTTGGKVAGSAKSVEGKNGFSVSTTVNDAKAGMTLLSQGNEWKLGVNADGKATFTVNGTTTTSDIAVTGGTATIVGVRENNGMLKVYVNGVLAGSAYMGAKNVDHAVKAGDIAAGTGATQTSVKISDRALGYDEVPASALADLVKLVEEKKDIVSDASWSQAGMDALLADAKGKLNAPTAEQKAAYDALYAGYLKLVPEAKVVNLALNVGPEAAWVDGSNGSVTNSGRPLSVATDGKVDDTESYAIFGDDNKDGGSYMQVDLGSSCMIGGVNLWRYWKDNRTYNATALVVANKADFSDKQVLYYSGDSDVYNLGVNPTESLYAETSAGKELFKADENARTAAVKARYVRLYGHGVKGGSKENHVVELQVIGKHILADPYGLSEEDGLNEQIVKAQTAQNNADKYESVDGLAEPLAAAQAVVERVNKGEAVTFGDVRAAHDALAAAIDTLVEKAPVVKVTVTIDNGDGTSTKVEVNKGDKLAKPADPVRDGYTFGGWFSDEACTKAFDFDAAVEGDMTVFAKWTKNKTDGDNSGGNGGNGGNGGSTDNNGNGGNNSGNGGNAGGGNSGNGGANNGGTSDNAGNNASNGQNGASNKKLPGTGDSSIVAIAGCAAVGAVAMAAGIWMCKRLS